MDCIDRAGPLQYYNAVIVRDAGRSCRRTAGVSRGFSAVSQRIMSRATQNRNEYTRPWLVGYCLLIDVW